MKAMILAAGEGIRLRPLTQEIPKALLPIGGVPLIEHILAWLKSHGISEVAINLYHLGEKIQSFLGDGSRFGMKIHYSPEETLLGTAGGVKRMEQFLKTGAQSTIPNPQSSRSTFTVVYGDNFTNFNLTDMLEFHKQKKAMVTLALFKAPNPGEAGIVELNKGNKVLSFIEKPSIPNFQSLGFNSYTSPLGSGGIYILEEEILNYIPSKGFFDFAYDIFPKLIDEGLPIYGYLLKPQDYLIDIGTPKKYHQANRDKERGRI